MCHFEDSGVAANEGGMRKKILDGKKREAESSGAGFKKPQLRSLEVVQAE